jgi:4-amino-4-deoxy-L-arabinose transferase-like glycosyltransferase
MWVVGLWVCVEHNQKMKANERRLDRLLHTVYRIPFAGYRLWLLLILLTAVFLRFYRLSQLPPGLTHDEAAHGLTAWEIVNGRFALYFTIGHGREPLFDYVNAALMVFTGPHWLPLRLTAVAFSLILLVGMAAWVRRAFDAPTALLTMAGLAVSFWPLMAGRQALRSIALPALFVLAVYCFWRAWESSSGTEKHGQAWWWAIAAGFLLGLTFYTYIPARVLWLVLPLTAVYGWLIQNNAWFIERGPKPAPSPGLYHWLRLQLVLLLVMLLVAAPLIGYLYFNPGAEKRVAELAVPLVQATEGNTEPLFANARGSLQLISGQGDPAWRYNIAGRPFLDPVMGLLFYLGLIGVAWRVLRPLWQRPDPSPQTAVACCLILLWLVAGFSPVLVTGPELASTQAIGMQPVLYLFPALALRIGGGLISQWWPHLAGLLPLAALLLFGGVAAATGRAYFDRWANEPAVREQYEATLMAVFDYLQEAAVEAAAVSTITPHPVHSPALALLALHRDDLALHWFDGRRSLLLPPAAESYLIFPGHTPPPAALRPLLETAVPHQTLSLRPTDLDRPVHIYRTSREEMLAGWQTQLVATPGVSFGEAAHLRGYALLTPNVPAGGLVQIITWWEVERPLPDARLFSHMLDESGSLLAQEDRLDVPGAGWQPGAMFVQLHQITIPEGTPSGSYPLTVGLYTFTDTAGPRLPLTVGGQPAGDNYFLTTIMVDDT